MRVLLLSGLLVGCSLQSSTVRHVKYGTTDRPRWDYEIHGGTIHGASRTYHFSGAVQSTGWYRAGQKHGLFRFYDEQGRLVRKTAYIAGDERWTSTDPDARPPDALPEDIETEEPPDIRDEPRRPTFSSEDPVPLFTTLDRTAAVRRGGLLVGAADVDDAVVVRGELFGYLPVGPWGVYGSVATATLLRDAGDLSGRRTVEIGGTRKLSIGEDRNLTLRAGLLAPVDNDDAMAFPASSAAANLRPTDVAMSMPATVAARTSASVGARYRRLVLQADAGIDWAMGGRGDGLDPLARVNVAAGYGVRSLLISLEASNVARVLDPSERLHALALGTTLWLGDVWLNGALSLSSEASAGVLLGGGLAF